jgi:hypothetical protein
MGTGPFADICAEKVEVELRKGVTTFERNSLKHIEPSEKCVLPTGEGNFRQICL